MFDIENKFNSARWLQRYDLDISTFGKAMKSVAITLILYIAGIIIWASNTLLSLAKYQREFYIVEIFNQLIPIIYKKTLLFLYKSQTIYILKVAYILNSKDNNKDKYDNFVIPTNIYSFTSFFFFLIELFY